MNRHTPGPWHADAEPSTVRGGGVLVRYEDVRDGALTGRREWLCEVYAANESGDDRDLLADARLIAAAPEMLELVRLVSKLRPHDSRAGLVNAARDLLARIEGDDQ